MTRRWLAAAAVAALLAAAGWFGWRAWQGRQAAPAVVQELPGDAPGAPETIETVQPDAPAIATTGTTPMAQRVATLGLLNKRTVGRATSCSSPGRRSGSATSRSTCAPASRPRPGRRTI